MSTEKLESKNSRPAMREDDPREQAKKRAKAIRGEDGLKFEEGVDEFAAPAAPDGWVYEWKRKLVANQEDLTHQNAMLRTGWEAVPVSRHPEMMQVGATGAIERKGMVLMERPLEIHREYQQNERNKARDAVSRGAKLKEEGLAARQDAYVKPVVNKSYSPMEIPDK